MTIKHLENARMMKHILLLLIFTFTGCHDLGNDHTTHQYHSLLERLDKENIHTDSTFFSKKPDMEGLDFVEVRGPIDTPPFYTLDRVGKLTRYPCVSCHTQSLSQMKSGLTQDQQKAHWDIAMSHASSDVMHCTTCHNKDNIEDLITLSGRTVGLNHSYKVCAQCHSNQYKDWVGGAHGKRVGGWTPPRVVQNCVNCHDPHQPAWKKRWPARMKGPTE